MTLHPSRSRNVTDACIRYASRLKQATDGERTSTFPDLQPCRPLPISRFIRLVPPRGSPPASAKTRSSSGCPLTPILARVTCLLCSAGMMIVGFRRDARRGACETSEEERVRKSKRCNRFWKRLTCYSSSSPSVLSRITPCVGSSR